MFLLQVETVVFPLSAEDDSIKNDIVILILKKELIFNRFVHPACLDLSDAAFNDAQISPDSLGKVYYKT